MVNFKDMTAAQLEEPPPSYDSMVKTIKSRVKAKVKRAMPRIREKVAALGKAKVAEKKKVAKKIEKKAGKMEGRVKEKKRVAAGKKQIIKGIKKIGAKELAKKKQAGARINAKASVAKKLPRIQKKVAKLGKQKASETRRVGKRINKKVKIEKDDRTDGRLASKRRNAQGLRKQDKLAIDFANQYDAPTDTVFINDLTDTVMNNESGNIVGTMYGGVFQPSKKLIGTYDYGGAPASPTFTRVGRGIYADPEADTSSEELEVEEITINGKLYYIDDSNGYIYDPETNERVPRQMELDYYNDPDDSDDDVLSAMGMTTRDLENVR